jgi:WD40 repeat protein
MWAPQTGRAGHTLIGHTNPVSALEIAPDGAWLASAGYDDEVRIWDIQTGQARHTLRGHMKHVRALAISPDGSRSAAAGGFEFGAVRL